MLKTIRRRIIKKVASRHVAGPDILDALHVCRWAENEHFFSILSPWKKDQQGAQKMLELYKLSIVALHKEKLSSYLSIKLDALDYDFGMFQELLEFNQKYNINIHVDSLDPESAAKKFLFLEKADKYHDILGCTLPSRWHRSLSDADRAVDLGLAVRIVKGQWPDPGSNQPDSRKNYLAIAGKLADRARRVGVATHDLPLAEKTLSHLVSSGTNCEMEQFFSLPLNGIDTAKKFGCPYRLYVSYGQPGVPYNVRFAFTRPAIAAWMATDFVLNPKKPWA